jgi:hypothetical protein
MQKPKQPNKTKGFDPKKEIKKLRQKMGWTVQKPHLSSGRG